MTHEPETPWAPLALTATEGTLKGRGEKQSIQIITIWFQQMM